MVPLGFQSGENPLPVPVPTLSPWSIQVPNPIKVKKFLVLVLEDLKRKKENTYFSY